MEVPNWMGYPLHGLFLKRQIFGQIVSDFKNAEPTVFGLLELGMHFLSELQDSR